MKFGDARTKTDGLLRVTTVINIVAFPGQFKSEDVSVDFSSADHVICFPTPIIRS